MRLSIVIPYYNRRALLLNVLRSINRDYPVDVIVVDDGSNQENRIEDIKDIILIRKENDGKWRGATLAYNTGFKVATGDVVMINSSECVHIGGVIEYVFRNFKSNQYIAFSALMGAKDMDIDSMRWRNPKLFLRQAQKYKTWWGVHTTVKNFIPYCAVISRKNLSILGGYDSRFVDGIGYDDYDFTDRIKNLGLKMKCVDKPFVFHQWHKPTDYPNTRNLDLLNRLRKESPNRIYAQ